MTEQEILEGNKLIAEFMGCEERDLFVCGELCKRWGFIDTHIIDWWVEACFDSVTPYHNSWDWLMPVVEKIEDISDYIVSIEGVECEVFTFLRSNSIATRHTVAERIGESKIEGVYLTVIDFIKWYNENLKPSK